jgi:hypothetical protein
MTLPTDEYCDMKISLTLIILKPTIRKDLNIFFGYISHTNNLNQKYVQ